MPEQHTPERREFLKGAGVLAASAAIASCEPRSAPSSDDRAPLAQRARTVAFDAATLAAVAEVVLPTELGAEGRVSAVRAFVAWADGYAPAAEEMHGYGYPDIRRLPADPAPEWRTQLDVLDASARTAHRTSFAAASVSQRRALLNAALASERDEALPAPLAATHIVIALLAHWASSADAWDLAFNARIRRGNCRVLDDAPRKPLPLAPQRLGGPA